MPYQWHFPRWRHVSMQGIMWLILGGSVGLAALLDGHLVRASIVTLGSPIADAPFSFQLPDDWNTQTQTNPDYNSIEYTATKPDDSDAQRVLKVLHQKITSPIFPAEYVNRLLGRNRQVVWVEGRNVAGRPGVQVRWSSPGQSDDQTDGTNGIVFCLIVPRPSQNAAPDAITVEFERTGPLEKVDQNLFDRVVNSIKFSP
jgi:hypothetical protein